MNGHDRVDFDKCNYCRLENIRRLYGNDNVRTGKPMEDAFSKYNWIAIQTRAGNVWKDIGVYFVTLTDHCDCIKEES